MSNPEQLPGRFAVSHVGACSFCGKRDGEVSSLAGIADRPHRICDECVSLCLDIIREELAYRDEQEGLADDGLEPPPDTDPRPTEYERLMQAQKDGDVDSVVAIVRRRDPGLDPEEIRHVIEHFRRRYAESQRDVCAERPRREPPNSCSFCDGTRDKVKKLIGGPGVAICDRCADDASADVLGVLRTP